MLRGILLLCVFAAVCGAGASLRCGWMDHKFRGCSSRCLQLIDSMATSFTGNVTGNVTVRFPKELYAAVLRASAEEKLGFTVQVLEEVVVLLQEDHSAASWDNVTVEHFRSAVTRQAEGVGTCIHRHRHLNVPLRAHFSKLSSHILERMGRSADAWELIRREIRIHLLRLDLLMSPLLSGRH